MVGRSATSRQLRVSVESSEQKDGCVEKKEGAPDETSANVATGYCGSNNSLMFSKIIQFLTKLNNFSLCPEPNILYSLVHSVLFK